MGALVLSRKYGERIIITVSGSTVKHHSTRIEVELSRPNAGGAALLIVAPDYVSILREELET